jgi:hypothetical protein
LNSGSKELRNAASLGLNAAADKVSPDLTIVDKTATELTVRIKREHLEPACKEKEELERYTNKTNEIKINECLRILISLNPD